jgi:hypothetical protein
MQKQDKRQRPRFRPCVEALEERYLLSGNYLVNSSADTNTGTGNTGTLRYCISQADNSGGGTVTFSSSLSGGTVSLTQGQLNISANMTITGLGAGSLTISGKSLSRVFDITSKTATVSISSLTISGGSISGVGGGIDNSGTLTLSDDALSGNDAKYGGGIFTVSGSTLIVQSSSLSGDCASQSGGGVFNSGTLTVNGGSTLQSNKASYGGAIRNDGAATISGSTLSANSAANGGAIFNLGSLTVSGSSTLSGNSATSDGAGIFNTGTATVGGSTLKSNAALNGGAIFSGGSVTISASSTLSKNSASYGGGIFIVSGKAVTVNSSTLSGNSASKSGGGVFNSGTLTVNASSSLSSNSASYGGGIRNNGTATVSGSSTTLSGNSAVNGGAILNLGSLIVNSGSSLSSNTASTDGAGIFNSGSVTVGGSSLSGNAALSGGGIFNAGTATVSGSSLSNNTASGLGGGIYGGGSVTVSNGSTLSSNSAKYGGGIFIVSGKSLTVNSSTVSGNSASYAGGGAFNSGTVTINNSSLSGNSGANAGGGIENYAALTVNNSTFSGNSGASGGGLFNYHSGTATLTNATIADNTATSRGGGIDVANGDVLLHNTLVAQNTIGSTPSDVQGTLDSTSNYNLIGDGSGGLTSGSKGNITGNPLLATLGNYGGTTETLALLPGSPAIDAGSSNYGGSTDQRGENRVNAPDIGAFESQGFTISVTSGNNQSTAFDTAFADPLVATVAAINSADGEPVAGGKITFTAPATGASATFSVNPATIGSNGQASVTATANSTSGSYSVVASAAGIGQSASFSLTNIGSSAIGPAPITNGQTYGSLPVSGRITGIAADPKNANIVYLASAGGGIWKSTDAADASPTWTPLTDNLKDSSGNPIPEFMGAVAETDATSGTYNGNQIVYAGTGETNNSFDSFYGEGILVSTNGGSTWTLTNAGGAFTGRTVSKIVIDPSDSTGGTAYAAVCGNGDNGQGGNTGIWKTTNFGQTWSNTTAANSLSTTVTWSDLVIDPHTPSTLYAAAGNPGGASGNGVYKSTNGGATWTSLSNGIPTGISDGRIALALYDDGATNELFVSIASPSNVGLFEMLQSTNGGSSFTSITSNSGLTNYLGTQGWYDTTLAIDPSNPNYIYAGGVMSNQGPTFSGSPLESFNGGQTWQSMAMIGSSGPHTDDHAVAFDANGNLLDGNDGGIFRLNDPTSSTNQTWSDLNTNLQITQFTGIAADTTVSNVVYGGSQDNGTEEYTGSLGWNRVLYGDGGMVRVDPTNHNTIYTETADGGLYVSTDGGSTFNYIGSNLIGNTVNFYAPYVLDSSGNIYFGADYLDFSSDQGSSFTAIGIPGTNNFNPNDSNIDAVAVSPTDNNVVYVSAGGHMFVTENAQAGGTSVTWTQIDLPNGSSTNGRGSFGQDAIAVDPSVSGGGTAYVVVPHFASGGKHVYKTTNFGSSWTDISGNLPNPPVDSVAVTPDGKTVYVGTDVGVYYTTNGGTSWSVLSSALPHAQVVDLEVVSSQNYLLIGTHGRGAWEVALSSSGSPLLTQDPQPTGTIGQTSAGLGNPPPAAPGPDSVNGSTTSSNSPIAAPSVPTPNSSPSSQRTSDRVFSELGQSWDMQLIGSNVQMLMKKDRNP